jgi:uncharacterized heparinase superfamily protein
LISRYFHTIRYLKPKQIYRRIWFNLIKPSIDESPAPKLRVLENEFCLPVQKKASLLDKNTFHFLDKSESLSKVGWNGNNNNISKLWRYNQHYFDDLNAIDSSQRKIWHDQLLKSWVNENKVGKGVGWEPYPTSLRIVNWVKWNFSQNILSNTCIQSLIFQARWLSKRIEWHILGNHLFSNAKALVYAGLFFSSKECEIWLKKGLKIIKDELNEQVLDDGGNFERSPMYHAIFLEDILDLINISRVYPKAIQEQQVDEWIKIANSMLGWLDTMIHPDGEISLFNDAAKGIAPNLDELKRYAQRLGVDYSSIRFNKVTHLQDSGYMRLTSNDAVILLDVALIGPDYLPAHAHADTLSFEFSLFKQRLLVNGGTSEYKISPIRNYERSTKAHNTVVVNNKNSSEVWSQFRVARRAYPFDLKIEELENLVNISCAHDGYKRLTGKPIHRRNWQFFESSLVIKDHVEGSFKNAYAYFHFHPSVTIVKNQDSDLKIEMPNGQQVILQIKTGDPLIEKSYYSSEFGKRIKTQCLKVALDKKDGSCVQILW